MNFVKFYRAWKEERRNTVECKVCHKEFNAAKQAGICPHIPIQEFIYGRDAVADVTRALQQDRIDPFSKEITGLYHVIISARKRHQTIKSLKIIDFSKE